MKIPVWYWSKFQGKYIPFPFHLLTTFKDGRKGFYLPTNFYGDNAGIISDIVADAPHLFDIEADPSDRWVLKEEAMKETPTEVPTELDLDAQMRLPLWVKNDLTGKYEVFPFEILTVFLDGKIGLKWPVFLIGSKPEPQRVLLRKHKDKFTLERDHNNRPIRYLLKEQEHGQSTGPSLKNPPRVLVRPQPRHRQMAKGTR